MQDNERISRLLRHVLLGSVLACGCAPQQEPTPAPTPAPQEAPGFDVGAVMRQVHFAYRPEGGRFQGGHSTYAVEVAGNGRIAFAPYLQPRAADGKLAVPLGLQTVAIGAERAGLRSLHQERDGSLALLRGAVVERLRNTEEGVEQSWDFAAQPPGQQDLVVRLQAEGLRYVTETSTGLHFADPHSGLGVRYGHGTWVDQAGRSTPVPARWQQGEVVLQVPRAVLQASSYPAVLDPTVSPEYGVDRPVATAAPSDQLVPRVAFDGTNYLVAWSDYRGGSGDIYGTRVSRAGTVLDPNGIAISRATGEQGGVWGPRLAFDGVNYLVVWTDARNGATTDIYGARVSRAGVVQDPNGIAVAVATGYQRYPAVAYDGSNFLVVWSDTRASTTDDIYAARITRAGSVIEPIIISSATNSQVMPTLSCGPTTCLVAWQDNRGTANDIYGARVPKTGATLDPGGLALNASTAEQLAPSMAFDGTNYLVAWTDTRNTATGWDIYGTLVSQAGVPSSSSGAAISSAALSQSNPVVAYGGDSYFVAWTDGRNGNGDVYGARVNRAGTVLQTNGVAVATGTSAQAVAGITYDSANYLITWSAGSPSDVYARRVSRSGVVLSTPEFLVSSTLSVQNTQANPAVAFDGTNYLLVWEDDRAGNLNIYGSRVSASGVALDPAGLAIATAATTEAAPAVASSGSNFLVAYTRYNATDEDIYGTLVTSAGVVGSAIALDTTSNSQGRPAVAFGATYYYVAWEELVGTDYGIYGRRVTTAGVPDSTRVAISDAGGTDQANPAVSFDSSNFLVVWEDNRNSATLSGPTDIYGARVAASTGAVLDNALAIAVYPDAQVAPTVASDGASHLVAWTDYRAGDGTSDVYGARVNQAGALLDPTSLALGTAPSDQGKPKAVYTGGSTYLVVYEDLRNSSSIDLYGARVTTGGSLLDVGGFAIATSADDEWAPTLASTRSNQVSLVGYQRLVAAYQKVHIRARLVSP